MVSAAAGSTKGGNDTTSPQVLLAVRSRGPGRGHLFGPTRHRLVMFPPRVGRPPRVSGSGPCPAAGGWWTPLGPESLPRSRLHADPGQLRKVEVDVVDDTRQRGARLPRKARRAQLLDSALEVFVAQG